MCLDRCVCHAVPVVGFGCRGVHQARWSTAACLQCWKIVACLLCCNLQVSCSDSYHQYLAKENDNRQVLNNNSPLQSTLTSFVVWSIRAYFCHGEFSVWRQEHAGVRRWYLGRHGKHGFATRTHKGLIRIDIVRQTSECCFWVRARSRGLHQHVVIQVSRCSKTTWILECNCRVLIKVDICQLCFLKRA